ncbi:hypothetical protein [Aurantiacibacter flavus]|uniref:Uncharacterized protein n=1 Tax=Aurantiacibacter flavus TaxID=3145232 RepID=A0ABV0CWR5_9SPHN
MTTTASSSRVIKMVQLVLQGLVAFVVLAVGVLNLSGMMTEEMVRLGYPCYFATMALQVAHR